jgi:serine/threonine protein kinase
MNPVVYNIAVETSRKTWPGRDESDLEVAARWIFQQVATAMNHLHEECNIVHRDLKHQNIIMGWRNADPLTDEER